MLQRKTPQHGILLLIPEDYAATAVISIDDRPADIGAVIGCRFAATNGDRLADKVHVFIVSSREYQDGISILGIIDRGLDSAVLPASILPDGQDQSFGLGDAYQPQRQGESDDV